MKGDRILSAEEACDRLDADPTSLGWPLHEFIRQFMLSKTEFLGEARSGRLVVEGVPKGKSYSDCFVTAQRVIDWIVHPDTPQSLRERVLMKMPLQ